MKVTRDELRFIDTYLKNSSIDYIDVRLELTDHIATAIEQELEENSSLVFYDAFKNYMVIYKKNLLENYELQKVKLRDKIIKLFLKRFISFEVLFLIIVSGVLVNSFNVIIYEAYFINVNFAVFVSVLIYYYVVFYKMKKTSVGGSLLSLVTVCYYVLFYIKNPLDLFFLIPVILTGYWLFKTIEKRINKEWSVIIIVLFSIVIFPMFLWFDQFSLQFVTDKLKAGYFFFQMIMWYMLFKTLRQYGFELNRKYKAVFT